MKKLIVGFLLVSTSLFAADEFHTIYSCRTPNIVDAGYSIQVETGGFVGLTQVRIAEETFAGARSIATFVVGKHTVGGSEVYQNLNSNLRDNVLLVLSLDQAQNNESEIIVPAHFGATVNGQDYSGDLTCVKYAR